MFESAVIAAPMAGGPSGPALVTAVARAGGFAFLAGGYKTATALAEEIRAVRPLDAAFGVNLFVPSAAEPDVNAVNAYRAELEPEARRYGVELPPLRGADDDGWDQKTALLLEDPVPVVSFTFGLPPAGVVAALRKTGSLVLASVTSVAEALAAADVGVDALVVQHSSAGSHTAAFLPAPAEPAADSAALVAAVRHAVALPLVAAGGIGDAAGLRRVLDAGAVAAQLGTAFLRTPESGARQLHKDALADPGYTETVLTRAFTGKPARALVNRFVREHSAHAPAAYPMVHHLTAPIRAAAAAQGDADGLNLWAGTGWRHSRDLPAAEVVQGFLAAL